MLSRVAERVYWMGRYLERVENAARLAAVYSELMLDLPPDTGLDWSVALQILGMEEAWQNSATEESELSFLLLDPDNLASVINGVSFARENARTTRDIVPSEAWNAINGLHIYATKKLPELAKRPGYSVPSGIVSRCHEISGILQGTMSHGPAYHFIRLGRSLERADMTSRIIDVAAAILLTERDELSIYDSTIWRAVLRALSAYQMYRQYVRRQILGKDVVDFLLWDPAFPRSVIHSVASVEDSLEKLPGHERAESQRASLQQHLQSLDTKEADYEDLHRFIDDLQLNLAALHNVIFETWLNPLKAG